MSRRRNFLLAAAASTAIAASPRATAQSTDVESADSLSADSKLGPLIRIGVMGLNRGQALALDFAKLPGVEVAYVCDVDTRRLTASAKELAGRKDGLAPKTTTDFREILADPHVDALVCAAPNHWHGPATIMACKAGKHVYVEKPCSHNPQEGEWMIAAAQQFDRCVQMGSQRRSAAGSQAAIAKLHAGAIGKVHLARCYYNNLRGPIGQGTEVEPPKDLNYDLWQGPAPRRKFRDNFLHYNWHWFWHWGGGELANNGVHGLDLCRWGLGVDFPTRTVSSGGRYWYADDQETPDVQAACFEFDGGKQITWDALSSNKHGVDFICAFFGDDGALELDPDGQYRVFDRNDKLVDEGQQSSGGQAEHIKNFVEAIRAGDPSMLNQPIQEGHKSTLLCHLGNIAYRTGKTVTSDSTSGRILGDPEQTELWQRDYEPAWRADVTF